MRSSFFNLIYNQKIKTNVNIRKGGRAFVIITQKRFSLSTWR